MSKIVSTLMSKIVSKLMSKIVSKVVCKFRHMSSEEFCSTFVQSKLNGTFFRKKKSIGKYV